MCARERSPKQRRTDGRGPAALGVVLAKALGDLGLEPRLRQAKVILDWPETVGKEIARHTRACNIRRGVLSVAVRTSAWAAQLAFLKAELVSRLNERAQAPIVHDIHWLVGNWPKRRGPRLVRRPLATPLRVRRHSRAPNASFH